MRQQNSTYKLFNKNILVAVLLLLLTSCENFLDQKPTDGLVLEEYWKNRRRAQPLYDDRF